MTPPIEPMTLTDWVMLIVVFLIVAAVLSELADRHRRR
jgi:cytochrome c-type biogenesis protein CcmH/NrfF